MVLIPGRGDPLPRSGASTRYRVVYPTPGSPLELLIVNPTWDGFDCHWLDREDGGRSRTVICSLPDECWCQVQSLPNKWHGYLGAVSMKTGKPVALSCTQRAMLTLLDIEPTRESLRGLVVIVERATQHPNSVATARRSPKDWKTALPAELNLIPTLEALYGVEQVRCWRDRVRGKDGAQ